MKKYFKLVILSAVIVCCGAVSGAYAAVSGSGEASPVGEWLVEEGDAHIQIIDCGKSLWGVTSWVKEPGLDDNNPDPAKRNRSTLGLPIILNMQAGDDGKWHGHIYNSQNGKTYGSTLHLDSDNILEVKGCLFNDFMCGGEHWKRIESQSQLNPASLCKGFLQDPSE